MQKLIIQNCLFLTQSPSILSFRKAFSFKIYLFWNLISFFISKFSEKYIQKFTFIFRERNIFSYFSLSFFLYWTSLGIVFRMHSFLLLKDEIYIFRKMPLKDNRPIVSHPVQDKSMNWSFKPSKTILLFGIECTSNVLRKKIYHILISSIKIMFSHK